MLIKEYRVVLPVTVAEYQVAQLYAVAEASKNETGGGEGVEVLKNEPYTGHPLIGDHFPDGQYTHKIYHLQTKVPWWVRKLAPAGSLELHETAWNAFPYCRTILTNPDYMRENFVIKVETMHLPDRGTTENAHALPPELLALREVEFINIGDNSNIDEKNPAKDPARFKSVKTGRGPLTGNWWETCEPVMTCYKLVTVEFKWWGFQSRVESFIHKQEKRLFTLFHRDLFCWTDQWYGLTMADIRRLEDETKSALDKQRQEGSVRGLSAMD